MKFILYRREGNPFQSITTYGALLPTIFGILLSIILPASAFPIIGPDVLSFGSLQPVTIIYHPLVAVQPQSGLPAPEGSEFDGPDPGLNANIIGGTDCPNHYRKDSAGICRLKFGYGPNPFSAIIPKTFKGSLQFYMGFQVGNRRPQFRRRGPFRIRGRHRNISRPRPTTSTTTTTTTPSSNDDDDD